MGVTRSDFGKTNDGRPVALYTLTNASGAQVQITDFGGFVVSIRVPDKDGVLQDVVLGYDNINEYQNYSVFYGTFVGRVGNRLKDAEFTIDGVTYQLSKNDGVNHLHGDFDKIFYDVTEGENSVTLSTVIPDGFEGYPGALDLKLTYALDDEGAFSIKYYATTDKATIINLTNHSYFNLNGQDASLIWDHELKLFCSNYTACGTDLIPDGRILPVAGTALDFTEAKAIGKNKDDASFGFKLYDNNFVIDNWDGTVKQAAAAYSPKTGIHMDVYTDQPGIQFYSSGSHPEERVGKNGVVYPRNGAFCLETQHFPSSNSNPSFPTIELRPGEVYDTTTIYKFYA